MKKLTSVDIKGEDGLQDCRRNFTNNGVLQHEQRWRRRRTSRRRRKRKGEEANKGQEADQPEEDGRILSENDGGKTDHVNVERCTVTDDADKSPNRPTSRPSAASNQSSPSSSSKPSQGKTSGKGDSEWPNWDNDISSDEGDNDYKTNLNTDFFKNQISSPYQVVTVVPLR